MALKHLPVLLQNTEQCLRNLEQTGTVMVFGIGMTCVYLLLIAFRGSASSRVPGRTAFLSAATPAACLSGLAGFGGLLCKVSPASKKVTAKALRSGVPEYMATFLYSK